MNNEDVIIGKDPLDNEDFNPWSNIDWKDIFHKNLPDWQVEQLMRYELKEWDERMTKSLGEWKHGDN